MSNNDVDISVDTCKEKGFTPKVFLECDDYTCRDMALLSGTCLGLTLGKSMNSGMPNVQYLRVSDFDAYTVSNLYYRKEDYVGNRKLFVDFLKQSVQ